MKKPQRLIALSPIEECLCLAALSCKSWDSLMIAGRNWIEQVIQEWINDDSPIDGCILVPLVQNPSRVRDLLYKAVARGNRIRWFAPEDSDAVQDACLDLPGVDLVQGSDMTDAFFSRYALPPNGKTLLLDLQNKNTDLMDFLRYKTSLSFMQEMDPAPLMEAAHTIGRCDGRPFSLRHLSKADARSLEHFREDDFPYIEGFSKPLSILKRRILQVAPTDMSILIIGETGTGKDYAAFYLHEYSPRRSSPYIALNCAGLDENLLRSELFGYKQGAFTGAIRDRTGLIKEADGGTLFLDEVGEMPLPIQADLLRFLQTKRFRPVGDTKEIKVNVRIIAATQPNLEEKIKKGEFRQDLYYRIADVVMHTPALREVPEDIPHIIRHLVYRQPLKNEHWKDREAAIAYFADHDEAIKRYAWPGNVRELLRAVRQRLLLGEDVVPALPNGLGGFTDSMQGLSNNKISKLSDIRPIQTVIQEYVRNTHQKREELGLSQQELAHRLGITVNTLKKHLKMPAFS